MYRMLCNGFYFYPLAFLKKSEGDIVIASVRPSVRSSVMLSPHKPLDEIQPNLMCVYSHEYMNGARNVNFFCTPPPVLSPGSCPKGGTWGYLGAKIKFRPAVWPSCYLLRNHWTKFNQIWCVRYSHEWGAQRNPPWGPGEGQKVKCLLISITKSISKIFYSKLCVCSHK